MRFARLRELYIVLTPLFEVSQVEEQARVPIERDEFPGAVVEDVQARRRQCVHFLEGPNRIYETCQ